MRREEAGFLLALAPSLLQVSGLTWAGARSSSRGTQLLRDGAVSRFVVGRDFVQGSVRDGEWPEQATLTYYNGVWKGSCSCNLAPCAHCVAVLLEAQRQARDAQRSGQQQTDVLGALRQRLQAQPHVPQATRILSDLERLPLEAAVDMVALGWRQNLRPGLADAKPMEIAADRVREHATTEPTLAREMALRLWSALGARKVVFVPLAPEVEQAALRLVPVIAGLQPGQGPTADQLALLADLALGATSQLAPLAAAVLDMVAVRQPEQLEPLQQVCVDWLQTHRPEWKEVAQPTGRDRLMTLLCQRAIDTGDLTGALQLAVLWPPLRSTLLALVTALAAAGRDHDAQRLADHFSSRDETWQAVQLAALDGAMLAGQVQAAVRICALALDLVPGPVWLDALRRVVPAADWAGQRKHQVEAVLLRDDPPWLGPWLLAQPDPLVAAQLALQTAPLADRTWKSCFATVAQDRPLVAFGLRALRLTRLAMQPAVQAKQLKEELNQLREQATALGEPGLATDCARLLGRELGDVGAVASAVSSAVRVW